MNSDLPVKKDNFLAEAENMDLSKIKDKVFGVSIATGDPDGVKYLCSALHGPYNYTEMLQEVGDMWVNHQHHAKVLLLSKNQNEKLVFLDANTVDYIELHYSDLIVEEMLGGMFDKDYTCQAGLTTEEVSSDPRHKSNQVMTTGDLEEELK